MDNFFVNLTQYDLISVAGKDSEVFLQGQLTCDLSRLSSPGACPGCLCDLKGRVLASFTLWKLDDIFYLQMASGLADIVMERLQKYRVFYKTEMTLVGKDFSRLGVAGEAAEKILRENLSALPDINNSVVQVDADSWLGLVSAQQQRYEFWMRRGGDSRLAEALTQQLSEAGIDAWLLLDRALGLYHLQASLSGLFTPQELNYDQHGFISFNKGCYTGQEIVARMHYRGKAKKRLYQLEVQSGETPSLHAKINTSSGASSGEIIDVLATGPGQYQVLVVANEHINEPLLLEETPDAKINLLKG